MTDKAPRGAITARIIDTMKAMQDKPMSETCARIATDCEMTVSYARAWYINLVKREKAPGVVEKAPRKAKPAKASKAPKVPKEKKVKTPKVKVDRKAILKAAAVKAGVHAELPKDEVAALLSNDDPLDLGAPASLDLSDLKTVL